MFENDLIQLDARGLLRKLRTLKPLGGMKASLDGRELTLFCTNDYLGLKDHPKVIEAARSAIDCSGFGSGAAPLISGYTEYHQMLSDRVTKAKSSDSSVVFGSGYLANTGVIPALAEEQDIILSDELNHASLIDGCRIAKAKVLVYRHNDVDQLKHMLIGLEAYRRRWVVTESVFSMDGDIAPLNTIVELCRSYGASAIIDDAHATGTIGPTGKGGLEHFGIAPEGVVQLGTLGKALGSYGAFVAADDDVVQWLINNCRTFMFSTSLPLPICAAATAAFDVIEDEPDLLTRLWHNTMLMRYGLQKIGLEVMGGLTPITPILIGDPKEAVRISEALMDEGYFAPAVRPPTVPEGGSRIRLTVTAAHTEEEIEGVCDALMRVV
jgi:8-amino-7-oxononanoate synthase